MSYPTIPDMEPVIGIDLCGAVDLLLASIAMEEISLSRLMDAESDKLRFALERCPGAGLGDIAAVNKSAEDMMKTLIKLQMLLQFKLENVRELVPCCTTTSTTTTTTTSTTSTASTTTRCRGGCCLMGTGRGCVENCQDPFRGRGVCLHVFLPWEDSRDRTVRYTVGDEEEGLYLCAAGREVRTTCPDRTGAPLLLRGKGCLVRTCGGRETEETAAYILSVQEEPEGRASIRMRLRTAAFSHDSGEVRVYGLRMGECH